MGGYEGGVGRKEGMVWAAVREGREEGRKEGRHGLGLRGLGGGGGGGGGELKWMYEVLVR